MPIQQLTDFLDRNRVKYAVISHSPANTAQETAALAHVPGRELAKTVLVKLDGAMAMAVLPASYQVNLARLAEVAGAGRAELATEDEFADSFPGCELGAMPPFGNLYGMPVLVAKGLAEDKEIAFNAGSHSELVRMRYEDFARLVQPRVASFTTRTD